MKRTGWMALTTMLIAGFAGGGAFVVACDGNSSSGDSSDSDGGLQAGQDAQAEGSGGGCTQWELFCTRRTHVDGDATSFDLPTRRIDSSGNDLGPNQAAVVRPPAGWEPYAAYTDRSGHEQSCFRRCAD